ncbi:hypothetical protein BofuT4_P122610.1 [Botrytis cinerea T4]|uniref:Fungal N-terminal domain-containing protein n=1 Tax=Botryotinia fuckeliana (strain T4) TaxID=999810 RepID=G2YNP4_BOTF4|nr:hypothetical protein BofuT4_P122610.1 [Botrytis cinerea T4]
MEAIGGIASVTGVVGFIGQIAGGCKVVKEIIGDIKNAPKDIRRLAECVKSIEESSNEVLRQHEQLKTRYGIQDIPAAGAHMLEAIKSVENKLSSSAEMFANSTSGSKNKWKQFWHRLKYAANKEEIETLMQWVDRTTQQVTLVQQNLSSIIQLEQSDLLKEISTNITAVPHAIHHSRDAIISAQQTQTETLRSEMQKNQSHLVQLMSTTIATKALEDVREDLLLSLRGAMEECIEAQRLDIGPQVQLLVGKCLQRDLPIHSAKIAENQGNDVSASLSSSTSRHVTHISHHAPSIPNKMQKRKNGRSLVSSTSYGYNFLGIGVSVTVSSHSNYQYQFSRSPSGSCDLSSTSVSVFLAIPWARRGLDLRYEMPSVPYSSESFISLRPYYIHAEGSEFHKAVIKVDIDTARNLIEQGKASPLDEVEGFSDLTNLLGHWGGEFEEDSYLKWTEFILGYQVDRYINTYELEGFLLSSISSTHETWRLDLKKNDLFETGTNPPREYGDATYYSTIDCAIKIGAWKYLFEMLIQIGWDEKKIQELYDEEIFLGIYDLMEGLQYQTMENAREEFLQQLLDGDDYSCFEIGTLPMELAACSWNISRAITHARFQYSEKGDIPGSWPEEEVVKESISEKDLIMPWCLSFQSWTEKDSLYYTCVHNGQYHTKCHVPRKEWDSYYDRKQLVDMIDDVVDDMASDEDRD